MTYPMTSNPFFPCMAVAILWSSSYPVSDELSRSYVMRVVG